MIPAINCAGSHWRIGRGQLRCIYIHELGESVTVRVVCVRNNDTGVVTGGGNPSKRIVGIHHRSVCGEGRAAKQKIENQRGKRHEETRSKSAQFRSEAM